MIDIKNVENCCGCGACSAICPKHAIVFHSDSEGFEYPKVNKNSCVNCGLCDKVCPINNQHNTAVSKADVFCGKNIIVDEQICSSSGGIFSILAQNIISKSGYVFGAAYNTDWNVEHISINNVYDLKRICRSKYVQSDNKGIYKEIKKLLIDGNVVLYSGTPCQVSSLKNYLGKEYEKLILVDIVCHGVPSPKIWQKYLKEICLANKEDIESIKDIRFKYKDGDQYHWRHPGFFISWNDGKEYIEFADKTVYENGFLKNLYVRPSCHSCKYKKLNSGSDVTIGDFWGCEKLYPEFFDKNGVSLIIVNTEKGRSLFSEVMPSVLVKSITIDQAILYNNRIVKSSEPHIFRKYFWQNISNLSLEKTVTKCLRFSILERLWFYMTILKNKIFNTINK